MSIVSVPEVPATAADLVGRALKITRQHWRPCLVLFMVPAFINNLASEVIYWVCEHLWSGYPEALLSSMLALAVVTDVVSKVVIGQRMLALQYFVSEQAADLRAGVDMAAKKWTLAAVLMLPVIVGDLFVTSLAAGCGAIVESVERHVNLLPSGIAEVAGLVLMVLYMLLSFPYLMGCSLNAFFMAILVREQLSLWLAMRRFLQLVFSPGGLVSFMILLTVVYYLLSVPVGAIQSLEAFADLLKGSAREVAGVVCAFIDACFLTPIAAFFFSSLAIAGVLMHFYLRVDLEGEDLKEQMTRSRLVSKGPGV
ncbi:MAG: hypothetical protein U0105_16245 [Candidatus Obscuribacterales bacterium]